MGPLCAGLAADRLAGLVNSRRACGCGGGIWDGLVQSGPLLLAVVCVRFDRVSSREARVAGFFFCQIVLSRFFLLIYCEAKKKGSLSHVGLTCMTDDWMVIR